MRCADCGLYECVLRSPMGGCPNGEKEAKVVIFTSPDTKPHNLGLDGIEMIARDYMNLKQAASDLVDTVEKYINPKKGDKYVFRNEVLAKVKELKEILK